MKKPALSVVFLYLALFCFVQTEASEEKLRQQADSLYQKAKYHFQQQDSIALFGSLSDALEIYQFLQDTNSIANVTNDFGYYYYFFGDFDKSIDYYRKALVLDEAAGDTIAVIGRHYNISGAYSKLGQFVPAMEHLMQGLELAKKIRRAKSLAMINNSLGGIFRNMEQYDPAAYHYHQSLSSALQIQDSLRASYTLNNLGMLHQELRNYDSARYYYLLALDYKQAVADIRAQANTMTSLGDLYLQQDSLQEAEPYFLDAQHVYQENADTYRLAWVSNKLARLYLRQQKMDQARSVLDSVRFYLQQELDARQERLFYLENETLWHEARGNPATALNFHKQWAVLRNSLFNEDKLKVQQIQSAYLLQQEEQARQLAQQEARLAQAESRRQMVITIAVSVILGIIIGLSLLLYRQYLRIERLSSKNELLLKELHHRVKNNLQVLSSMLRMQARRLQEKLAKDAMTESELRVQAMSLIHRRLYGASLTEVPMKSYLEELIQEIKSCYGCTARLDMQIEDVVLDDRQAVPIGLIVNEVVSNACKYAFPDHPNPELKVRLVNREADSYQLSLHDNGPGLELDEMKRKRTFGLELIMLQAEQIYARATFTNQQGSLFTLHFRKAEKYG